jgi:hypothetical protein
MKNCTHNQYIYNAEFFSEIHSFLRLNFYTLGNFYRFFKLILDNPFQTRMVAKFPNGFSLSFFSLRHNILQKEVRWKILRMNR